MSRLLSRLDLIGWCVLLKCACSMACTLWAYALDSTTLNWMGCHVGSWGRGCNQTTLLFNPAKPMQVGAVQGHANWPVWSSLVLSFTIIVPSEPRLAFFFSSWPVWISGSDVVTCFQWLHRAASSTLHHSTGLGASGTKLKFLVWLLEIIQDVCCELCCLCLVIHKARKKYKQMPKN